MDADGVIYLVSKAETTEGERLAVDQLKVPFVSGVGVWPSGETNLRNK